MLCMPNLFRASEMRCVQEEIMQIFLFTQEKRTHTHTDTQHPHFIFSACSCCLSLVVFPRLHCRHGQNGTQTNDLTRFALCLQCLESKSRREEPFSMKSEFSQQHQRDKSTIFVSSIKYTAVHKRQLACLIPGRVKSDCSSAIV